MFTKRNLLIAGIALLAMGVVLIASLDWSGKEDVSSSRIIVRTPKPSPPALPSALEAQKSPTVNEPVEGVAAVPEPPKEVTYEEAEAAFHEKQYEKAVELFTRYTERKDKNPWGFYMLGLSAWMTEDFENAERAFNRALELDSLHVKSWLSLSRVLLDTDKPEEALTNIDKALVIDPESNVAYRLRGRAFYQQGQKEKAIDAYRRAIQIDNQDVWSMNNLGLVFIDLGRFDEALPPLARAVELKDDIAVFQNNLGMALEHAGRFRAAEEAYSKAIKIDEAYDKAYANLDRVADVVQDSGLEPLDLGVVAQNFTEQIKTWKLVEEKSEQTEFVETAPDSIVVSDAGISRADSTGNRQDQ